ncbi:hypothetical protein GW17_00060003 [Ensete ventricosum]|nr:hypothetical protein GW17_00060003 [Ensete ventricosum]
MENWVTLDGITSCYNRACKLFEITHTRGETVRMGIAVGYYCSQQLARATFLGIEADKCGRIMLLPVVARNGAQARLRTSSPRRRPMTGYSGLSHNGILGFVMAGLVPTSRVLVNHRSGIRVAADRVVACSVEWDASKVANPTLIGSNSRA